MRDEIVWDWNTTELTSGQLASKYKLTKGQVLGIVHRDPRAVQRRPKTEIQKAQARIKALEAEVLRLRAFEVQAAQR